MPAKKFIVDLTSEEREHLLQLISRGKPAARQVTRARILLKADEGCTDAQIVSALGTGVATVERVRRRFVEEGLEAALHERKRPGQVPKLDAKQIAHLTALACSTALEGRPRWTLRMLADRMVALEIVDSLSYETVRVTLKKTSFSPGAVRSGVSRMSAPSS